MEGGETGRKWLRGYLERKEATWPQVLGSRPRWYAPPFEAYNVRFLPLYLLLDRDGKIAAVNPRGRALDRAVERELSRIEPVSAAASTYQ